MIVEFICYKCTCAKCGAEWKTRTHDLPKTCAKCKTTKWNADYVPAPDDNTSTARFLLSQETQEPDPVDKNFDFGP